MLAGSTVLAKPKTGLPTDRGMIGTGDPGLDPGLVDPGEAWTGLVAFLAQLGAKIVEPATGADIE